jgi:hypothetical protein
MPGFVNVLGTFRGTWDQPNKNPGEFFWCAADTFWNSTNCKIQWPGMLIARKICRVRVVGCTNDRHDPPSGRKLMLCIPPPFAMVHLIVDSTNLTVREAHRFKIEVCLKWEMCQKELDTFENIPDI